MFLTFSWDMGPELHAAILYQQRPGFEGEQSQRSEASARLVYRI